MKQKNNSQPVTKNDLKKEFKQFENRFEKRMEKKFATKEYLDKRFDSFAKAFRAEIKFDMNNLMIDIRSELSQFRNQFFTLIDPLIKDIEERREAKEIEKYQITELRDHVDNHEKRITNLEQTHPTT